jgi:hypothetical protein
MAEFGPAQEGQKGYRKDLNRQIVALDQPAELVLGGHGYLELQVVMADESVAQVTAVYGENDGESRRFRVTGLELFAEAFLEGRDGDGRVMASINIGVGPIHARFGAPAGQAGFDASACRQTLGFCCCADITLTRGDGLVVTSNDPTAVAVTETTGAVSKDPRTFRIKGLKSNGHATIMASAPAGSGTIGGAYAFLSVSVGEGPKVAPVTNATPTDGHTTAPQPLGDVPQELLDAAVAGTIPFKGKPSFWTDEQGKFAFKYFLHGVKEMRSHAMPIRSAALLVAQAGVETSYGKLGKNPSHNNFLSFQPPKDQADQLRDKGIPIVIEDRINKVGGKPEPTPVPHYKDIPQSIRLQIEVVLPQLFPSLLALLKDPKTTGDRYAAAADSANYGALYVRPADADPKTTTSYADELRRSIAYLEAMLEGLPTTMSEGTRLWAQRVAQEL